MRHDIRVTIRELYRTAREIGIPVGLIADTLGISRQQLDNIVKERPGGRQ